MNDQRTLAATSRLLSELQLHGDTPLPRFPTQTAVGVFPGEYQEWRIQEAIRILWKVGAAHFLIAGTAGNPLCLPEDILEEMERMATASSQRYRSSPLLVCGVWANDTRDQARFIMELLKRRPEVTHLVLTTGAYHLPRCVLTCIKYMTLRRYRRVVIYTAPSGADIIKPGSPEFEEEMAKIPRYQTQRDIATWDELESYLAWRDLEIPQLQEATK